MIGQTISHYKIIEKIGEGGMGRVFKAHDEKLKRLVAIKFLNPQALSDEKQKSRFVREAQSAASLNHPNIATIYEFDEILNPRDNSKQAFIVMEYIEGETLHKVIKRCALSIDQTLSITTQLASGLSIAHNKGIIHRDLKPANVILTQDRTVKILDFGLAKLLQSGTMSLSGQVVGTAGYMSPEQIKGESVDARTDIWALGVIVFEMLTQHLPFRGEHFPALMYSIANEEPQDLMKFRQDVPENLQSLCKQCLEKDRESRLQSMTDVSSLLGIKFQESKSEKTRPLSFTNELQNKKRRRIAALAVLLIFAISLGLWKGKFFSNNNPSIEKAIEPSVKKPTSNTQAYDDYLRAKFLVRFETPNDNDSTIALLDRAVTMDPNFAEAYGLLAYAYYLRLFWFKPGDKLSEQKSEVALQKAQSLNPNLAVSHFAKARSLWTPGGNFQHEQAIQEYRRALILDPSLDEAHHQLGLIFAHIGLFEQAHRHLDTALNLNPQNIFAKDRIGWTYICEGNFEKALAVFEKTRAEFNPSIWGYETAWTLLFL